MSRRPYSTGYVAAKIRNNTVLRQNPSHNAHKSANTILDALADAFGGYSQFSDHVVGAAIFGQFNNGGAATAGGVTSSQVIDAAADIITERWEDTGADLKEVRSGIEAGYNAARRRILGHSENV